MRDGKFLQMPEPPRRTLMIIPHPFEHLFHWWRFFSVAHPASSACATKHHRCDSRPKYLKEQISSAYTHTCQFSHFGRQAIINKNVASGHSDAGLESHSRLVRLGSKIYRMKLLASVCSQAACIHRCCADFGAGEQISCSLSRSANTA